MPLFFCPLFKFFKESIVMLKKILLNCYVGELAINSWSVLLIILVFIVHILSLSVSCCSVENIPTDSETKEGEETP